MDFSHIYINITKEDGEGPGGETREDGEGPGGETREDGEAGAETMEDKVSFLFFLSKSF